MVRDEHGVVKDYRAAGKHNHLGKHKHVGNDWHEAVWQYAVASRITLVTSSLRFGIQCHGMDEQAQDG